MASLIATLGRVLPVFAAAAASVVACSSTETTVVDEPVEGGTAASPDSGLGIARFMPSDSYSGFDGTHTYTFPIAVYDTGDDLTVTASDPAAADIAPKSLVKPVSDDGVADNGKYFFVTTKKAGSFTLTAKSGSQSATGSITVTPYTASSWTVGQTRYMNGGMGDPPCANCHVSGEAIDHSPAAIAFAPDEKVAAVITTGITTHGVPIQINGEPGHRWKVSDDERAGLVTYLRSLTPRGFK